MDLGTLCETVAGKKKQFVCKGLHSVLFTFYTATFFWIRFVKSLSTTLSMLLVTPVLFLL